MSNIRDSLIAMVRYTFADDDASFGTIKKELQKVDIAARYPVYAHDNYLNSRYSDMKFEETDTYFEMHEKLLQFKFAISYELLANGSLYKLGRLISADDIRYDVRS